MLTTVLSLVWMSFQSVVHDHESRNPFQGRGGAALMNAVPAVFSMGLFCCLSGFFFFFALSNVFMLASSMAQRYRICRNCGRLGVASRHSRVSHARDLNTGTGVMNRCNLTAGCVLLLYSHRCNLTAGCVLCCTVTGVT